MNRDIIAKKANISSSVSGEYGHLLNVAITFGKAGNQSIDFSITLLLETDIRTWKDLHIESTNSIARYLLIGKDFFQNVPLKLSIKRSEANIFKVEFEIQLNPSVKVDDLEISAINGKCQGKYSSISIKESSEFNKYHENAKDLGELIEISDYLVNQPENQFNGAVGYAVKI